MVNIMLFYALCMHTVEWGHYTLYSVMHACSNDQFYGDTEDQSMRTKNQSYGTRCLFGHDACTKEWSMDACMSILVCSHSLYLSSVGARVKNKMNLACILLSYTSSVLPGHRLHVSVDICVPTNLQCMCTFFLLFCFKINIYLNGSGCFNAWSRIEGPIPTSNGAVRLKAKSAFTIDISPLPLSPGP